MNKFLIRSIVALIFLSNLSLPTAADPTPYLSTPVSSIQTRIGLGLGVEHNFVDAQTKIIPPSTFGRNVDQRMLITQTARRFQLAPSVEIGATIDNEYYVGLFASWRYSAIKKSTQSVFVTYPNYLVHEFQLKEYTDILLKAGYRFTPRIMCYGLVGPSIASWSHTTKQFLTATYFNNITINKTGVGLGLGFGFEYLMKKKYAISLEYTYHLHRHTTKSKFMTVDFGGGNLRSGNVIKSVDPSYQTIAARFTYFFNL